MTELRNTPQQERARASLERILVAAEAVLEEVGPDAATSRAIAEKAGVSVGTLYRFFPDKAAIIRELVRRYVDNMPTVAARLAPDVASLVASLDLDSMESVATLLIQRSLALHASHPAWRRVRQWHYPDTGEIVSAPVRAAESAMISNLVQALPYGVDAATADMIAETTSLALWPLIERALDDPERSELHEREAVLLVSSYVVGRLTPFKEAMEAAEGR